MRLWTIIASAPSGGRAVHGIVGFAEALLAWHRGYRVEIAPSPRPATRPFYTGLTNW